MRLVFGSTTSLSMPAMPPSETMINRAMMTQL
jgi:hypothetical protein